ncbi:MAG: carbon storage regulator [Planctomycetia bacterium]|nr:carbon storage regulator [Planctomycetia bacterium]
MLILSRKLGESVRIGDEITIRVVELRRSRVRIGIDAPLSIRVQRQEHAILEDCVGQIDDLSIGDELLLGVASDSD